MVEPYPLEWPSHIKPTTHRSIGPYRVSLARARDDLYKELELFGATKVVISSNARLRLDGKLAASQPILQPSTSGVAVYFTKNDEKYVIACDRWVHLQDNIRAVGLTINAMRAIERHGTGGMVASALSGYKAIPAQTGYRDDWWLVLGISNDATRDELDTAFRERSKTNHPDVGGDEAAFHRITEAYRAGRSAIAERA